MLILKDKFDTEIFIRVKMCLPFRENETLPAVFYSRESKITWCKNSPKCG